MAEKPSWQRLTRDTLAAAVASEESAQRRLARASRDNEKKLLTKLPSTTLAAALQAARASSGALVPALDDAVLTARLNAKRASAERLTAEWKAVQAEVTALGFTPPNALALEATVTKRDRVAARVAAHSLSEGWQAALTSALTRARATPGAFHAVTRAAIARMGYRLRRTAATENTRAFVDVRLDAMAQAARRYRREPWFSFLGKRWDATLDAHVCNVCGGLHDEIRPWGVPFPDDAIPGYLHPNCRCCLITTFVTPGAPTKRKSRPTADRDLKGNLRR